eukprot:jgi/Ulvmu1/872/UM100_0025.1
MALQAALNSDDDRGSLSLQFMQSMLDEQFTACFMTYSCLTHHIHGLSSSDRRPAAASDVSAANPVHRCGATDEVQHSHTVPLADVCHARVDQYWPSAGPIGEGVHHVTARKTNIGDIVGHSRDLQRHQRPSALHLPTASQAMESQVWQSTLPNASMIRFSEEVSSEERDQGSTHHASTAFNDDGTVLPMAAQQGDIAVKEDRLHNTPYALERSDGAPLHRSALYRSALYRFCVEVLPPDHRYIAHFKAMLLCICMATVLAVPFHVSFHTLLDNSLPLINTTLAAVEVMFLLDIYNNFRTGYYSATRACNVLDRRLIALRYVRSHLLTDILAAIPVTCVWRASRLLHGGTWMIEHARDDSLDEVVDAFSMLQLLKIFKIAKLAQLTVPLEGLFGSAQVAVARLIFTFIAIFHGTACGFHLMSFLSYSQASWIESQGLDGEKVVHRYIASLYWTFTTITTTGYGDIAPATIAERSYSMGAMLLGLTVFSYFISSVSQAVEMMDAANMRSKEQRRAIDMFAQLHKLPRSMHGRVRAYYDYLLRNAVHDLDSHIVTSLSPQLRQDVLLFLYSDLVAKVPFFRNKSHQFIAELIQKLRAEVYPPGEYVTVEGQLGYTMFFVRTGQLEVRVALDLPRYLAALATMQSVRGMRRPANSLSQTDDDDPDSWIMFLAAAIRRFRNRKVAPSRVSTSRIGHMSDEAALELQRYRIVRTLSSGEYFGELACLTGVRRTASIVAVQYSETMSLSKDALDATVSEFPAYKFAISTEVEGYHALVQELIGSSAPVAPAAADAAAAAGPQGGVGEAAAAPPAGAVRWGRQERGSGSGEGSREGHRRSHSAPSGSGRGTEDQVEPRPAVAAGAANRSAAAATAARTGLLERMRMLDVAVEGDPASEGVPGGQAHAACDSPEAVPAPEPIQDGDGGAHEGHTHTLPLPSTALQHAQHVRVRSGSTALYVEQGMGSREMQEALGDGVVRVQQLAWQLQQQVGARGTAVAPLPGNYHRHRHPLWGGAGPRDQLGPNTVGAGMAPVRNELQDFMRTISNGSLPLPGHSSVETPPAGPAPGLQDAMEPAQ